MQIITLSDYSLNPVCEIDDGWPTHTIEDCHRLLGVVPYSEHIECSVCGLEWGDFAVSPHESCALLYHDGTRKCSHPRTYVRLGEDWAEIIRTFWER